MFNSLAQTRKHFELLVTLFCIYKNRYKKMEHDIINITDLFSDLNHKFNLLLYAVSILAIGTAIGEIIKHVVLWFTKIISRKHDSESISFLRENNFFSKICNMIPPIIVLIFLELTLPDNTKISIILTNITYIYLVVMTAIAVNSIIFVLWVHLNNRKNKRNLPLQGLVSLLQGIVWIVVVISIIAILSNKSPGSLFAGLGAFAAVLMLIFKDSILGLVAGIQLSENDSLHVGDWIKVEGSNADGIVTEVSLTTVKVQNFDKTITTIPPYTLVSNSFTNYRTMSQSNTRRIYRSCLVDIDSVAKLDNKTKDKIREITNIGMLLPLDTLETAETNLTAFRIYIRNYLKSDSNISHNDLIIVSTLQPTATGIPLFIYCFTNTSRWSEYENIQAAIFEHVYTTMNMFGLRAFEYFHGIYKAKITLQNTNNRTK
jgi:miniconductance mechanosensitive channel